MKALITGITGQDGSYLSEVLLKKDYEVHGIIRRASNFNTQRIDHIYNNPKLHLHYGDLSDSSALSNLIFSIKPDEIYNLAAMSHVKVSFEIPEYTGNITGLGVTRILETIRELKKEHNCKFYNAASSEMFGNAPAPQNENTVFDPRSPYAAAKVYAFNMTKNYREAYGIFACNGILFNHESSRRGETFVTKKITKAIAKIKKGEQDYLYLGNLESKRDWGYSPDYCEAMFLMLQHNNASDYVIGTGETHTVREFVEEAFSYAGLDWKKYVKIDPKYFRPTEVDLLLADYSKAKKILGWEPKTNFKQLVKLMVDAEFEK